MAEVVLTGCRLMGPHGRPRLVGLAKGGVAGALEEDLSPSNLRRLVPPLLVCVTLETNMCLDR